MKKPVKDDKGRAIELRQMSGRPYREDMDHSKIYDEETKKKAVKRIIDGKDTRTNVAKRLGVGYTTVDAWVKKALLNKGGPRSSSKRIINYRSPSENIVRLKPIAWLSDWTIDHKIGASHGDIVCNSCLRTINNGDLCVVIKRQKQPPDDVLGAYCLQCMLIALRDTQKYLSGLRRVLLSGDLKASVDLSDLHDKYNCVYRKRKVLSSLIGPMDVLTKKELIRYLENERLENMPDELKQAIELEKIYFESNAIPEFIRIKSSAFLEDEVFKLWKEEGISIRSIGKRLNMACQTVGTILKRHQGKKEKIRGKLYRLERENRQLRRVLCHFAERIL